MYQQQGTSKSEMSIPAASAPSTRLPRRWLFLARSTFALLVLLTLGVFIASLPVYFALLQTVCTVATQCASGQLSTHTAPVVHALGLSLTVYATVAVSIKGITVLVWVAVAGVIFWRKSEDWVALLVALMLVAVSTGNAETDLPMLAHLVGPSLALVVSSCSNFLSTLSLFLVLSLFPDGRFVPRWTRWIVVVAFVLGVVNFFPFLSSVPILTLLWNVLWLGCALILAIIQVYRYRWVSLPMQRQQTKWVVFSLAIVLILGTVFGAVVPELIFPSLGQPDSLYQFLFNGTLGQFFGTLPIPLSFAIALLRYRLWDVDVLINRALVYGALTTSLALVYFGLIFALQSLFQGMFHQNNAIAIVISTLAIAAIFQPLRHRIQVIIDRRFYRRKYDAAKVVAAFSATLRQEVDLDQLRVHLLEVVQETMQPTHVSLWLRPPAHDSKQRTPWRATPPLSSDEGK
jgi:hypothetical protein